MSASYPIPRGTRDVTYGATAGQKVFGPIPIPLYDRRDVAVLQTLPGGAPSLLNSDDYVVDLIGPLPSNFTLTFFTGRSAGATITILGTRTPARTTDVTRAGALQSQSLEAELDKMTVTEQELRRDVNSARAESRAIGAIVAQMQFLNGPALAQIAAAVSAANSARDQAISAAGQSILTIASRAAMVAMTAGALAGVTAMNTLGRDKAGGGGGAMYVRLDGNPNHAAAVRLADRFLSDGVTVDNVNGGYVAPARSVELSPEMCGAIGVNVATDTATVKAWAIAVRLGGYTDAQAHGEYLIDGAVLFGAQSSLRLNLRNARFRQQSTSGGGIGNPTLLFDQISDFAVEGGGSCTFYGFADKVIAAGKSPVWSTYAPGGEDEPNTNYYTLAPAWSAVAFVAGDEVKGAGGYSSILFEAVSNHVGVDFAADLAAGKWKLSGREYRGASSSHNGVAAMYFQTCGAVRLKIDGVRTRNHAGGSIFGYDCVNVVLNDLDLRGIGSNYIGPGDNGSDIGVTFQASALLDGYRFNFTLTNSVIRDHAIGWQAVLARTTVDNCTIGPMPGQHGGYQIDCFAHKIDFTAFQVRRIAFKEQHENYPGRFFGTAWATATVYNQGAEARVNGTLYVCITTHTAGVFATDLAAGKWQISSQMRRPGGRIAVSAERCGSIIQIIRTSEADGKDQAIEDLVISGATGRDLYDDGMVIDNAINVSIGGNTIDGAGRYGILFRSSSGHIFDNVVARTQASWLFGRIADFTSVHGNVLRNVGLDGGSDADRTPVWLDDTGSNDLPSRAANPILLYHRNIALFTGGGVASTYLGYTGSTIVADVIDNFQQSPGAKLFRCDKAEILRRPYGNNFGFTAAAHNLPTFAFSNAAASNSINGSTATAAQVVNLNLGIAAALAASNQLRFTSS